MRIDTEQPVSASAPAGSAPSAPAPSARSSAPLPQDSKGQPQAQPAPAPPQVDGGLTYDLQRDADGKFFYALVDPHTGKVISETPPEAIREVGKSIDEFLKAEQARQMSKISTKA